MKIYPLFVAVTALAYGVLGELKFRADLSQFLVGEAVSYFAEPYSIAVACIVICIVSTLFLSLCSYKLSSIAIAVHAAITAYAGLTLAGSVHELREISAGAHLHCFNPNGYGVAPSWIVVELAAVLGFAATFAKRGRMGLVKSV